MPHHRPAGRLAGGGDTPKECEGMGRGLGGTRGEWGKAKGWGYVSVGGGEPSGVHEASGELTGECDVSLRCLIWFWEVWEESSRSRICKQDLRNYVTEQTIITSGSVG